VLCISYCNKGILGIIHSRLSTKPTRLQRKCQDLNPSLRSQNTSPRPQNSRSQSRDLLEISVPRPSRDLSPETFSKSQFRDLLDLKIRDLEISVPRPSRDLSSETFLRSETFSRSQIRDLLEISKSETSETLESKAFETRGLSSKTQVLNSEKKNPRSKTDSPRTGGTNFYLSQTVGSLSKAADPFSIFNLRFTDPSSWISNY
jgi:hypothetical protein